MRGPERSAVAAPGTIGVITVGASETFGLRESPGKEYPRQLEDSLAAWVRQNDCPSQFRVLNAAFAGMSLPTIDQDVRLRLYRLHPAIIVVYPSSAQYLQDDLPIAAKPDSTPRAGSLSFRSAWTPRAWFRFREQIKQTVPEPILNLLRGKEISAELENHPPGWRFSSFPIDRLGMYDADLRRLVGTIRGIGAQPVLVTHGNLFMDRRTLDKAMLIGWEKFYPRAPGKLIVAFDSAARVVTMRVAADSGVVAVDAAKRLAAAPATIFADFVHFTDSGSSIMADAVRRGVLSAARAGGVCLPASTKPLDPSKDPGTVPGGG
jgi:hypothetical protein